MVRYKTGAEVAPQPPAAVVNLGLTRQHTSFMKSLRNSHRAVTSSLSSDWAVEEYIARRRSEGKLTRGDMVYYALASPGSSSAGLIIACFLLIAIADRPMCSECQISHVNTVRCGPCALVACVVCARQPSHRPSSPRYSYCTNYGTNYFTVVNAYRYTLHRRRRRTGRVNRK